MRYLWILLTPLLLFGYITHEDVQIMRQAGVRIAYPGEKRPHTISKNATPESVQTATYLDFNGQKIYDLPSWIAEMSNLTRIDLEGSDIGVDGLQTLKDLPNLLFVSVGSSNQYVDANLSQYNFMILSTFKNFKLSLKNELKSTLLKVDINPSNVMQIESIHLSGSRIYHLPSWFFRLQHLSTLILDDTQLPKHYIDDIASFKSLRILNLNKNKGLLSNKTNFLTKLPAEITELYLANTGFKSGDFSRFAHLRVLDLSNNPIESIDTFGLKNLPLIELKLANTSLSGTFDTAKLPQTLQFLDLTNNNIEFFKYGGYFRALAVLKLGGNKSIKIDEKFGGVFALTHLKGFTIHDTIKLPKAFHQKICKQTIVPNIAMVRIEKGSFMMGNNIYTDTNPEHKVTIDYPFEIGKYEVTFKEYDCFCVLTNRDFPDDSGFGRGDHPVINVSWYDAKAFTKWLSKETGKHYRLPTEAEWEYACRAGTTTDWSFGDDVKELRKYSWYGNNSNDKTHTVGNKLPNPWGLYDMHGNVKEWCEDWYVKGYYGAPKDGSANKKGEQKYKIIRGGSWNGFFSSFDSPSYKRDYEEPNLKNNEIGLRLLRTLP